MMKRLTSGLFLSLAAIVSLAPFAASAQSLQQRESQFCSSLSSRIDDIQNGFKDKIGDYIKKSDKLSEEAAGRRIITDESLSVKHKEYDEMYQQWSRQSLSTANDDERKAAVNEFNQKIQNIVNDQRQEYADIRAQFRGELDEIKAARRQAVTEKADEFSKQAEVALELAKISCSRQREPQSETRSKLIKSLESARLSYAEFRRSQAGYEDQIKQAIEKRTSSIKVSKQKFEQAFMQASQEFKPEVKDKAIDSSLESGN